MTDPYGVDLIPLDQTYPPSLKPRSRAAWLRPLGIVASAALALTLIAFLVKPQPAMDCRPTVLVVDTSSSALSGQLRQTAADVVAAAAERAALCDKPLHVLAERGTVPELVLDDAALAGVTNGATFKARKAHLDSTKLDGIVAAAVQRLYRDGYTGAAVSSIPALYAAVAPFASPGLDLLIDTDGVQTADGVSLDRALAAGEGASIADSLPVTTVAVQGATLFGLSLVDAKTTPPGARWAQEVIDANAALCKRATGVICRTFTVASANDIVR